MEFETVEHILLPFLATILGAVATWLKMRSDGQTTKISRMEADRDDRRDDFDTLARQQAETIKRLDARITQQDTRIEQQREKIEKLENALDDKDAQLSAVRGDVGRFKLVYQMMRKAVLTECGHQDCPLWRYLDDKERDALLQEMVGAAAAVPKG